MKLSNKLPSKRETLVLLLQRGQLVFFVSSKNTISTWQFDPQQVRDLELIDEPTFTQTFEKSCKQLGVNSGTSVVLILDNTIAFTQPLPETKPAAEEKATSSESANSKSGPVELHTQETLDNEERKEFTQKVPFTNTFSTILDINKQKTILAVNRDLYEPLVRSVEAQGMKMSHILPMMAIGGAFAEGFTEEAISKFLKIIEKYKQYNLLQTTITRETQPLVSTNMQSKEHPQRIYLLIGVFMLLLLMLGGVWYWSKQREEAELAATSAANESELPAADSLVSLTANPEPTVVPQPTADPIASDSATVPALETLVLEIQYSAANQELATQIAATLEEQEIETISVLRADGDEQQVESGQIVISVAPNIPTAIETQLEQILTEYDLTLTFVQAPELGVDMRLAI